MSIVMSSGFESLNPGPQPTRIPVYQVVYTLISLAKLITEHPKLENENRQKLKKQTKQTKRAVKTKNRLREKSILEQKAVKKFFN